eukprot:scaffold330_cov109-Isochrysis_galbana.AAC.10
MLPEHGGASSERSGCSAPACWQAAAAAASGPLIGLAPRTRPRWSCGSSREPHEPSSRSSPAYDRGDYTISGHASSRCVLLLGVACKLVQTHCCRWGAWRRIAYDERASRIPTFVATP